MTLAELEEGSLVLVDNVFRLPTRISTRPLPCQ